MSYTARSYGIGWATPHAITTASGSDSCGINSTFPSSTAAYPTADLAIYIPVRVKQRVVVRALFAAISGASGNFDIGVFDATGTKIVSAGITAAAASKVVDITDTTIGPGLYYLAVTSDNTTTTMLCDNDAAPMCASIGVLTEQLGTGAALPATATWAANNTLAYYPVLAMLLGTTVA